MNRCDKTIGWADWTWNPITGCKHGCSYCYARKIATRFKETKAFPNGFEPTWYPERLMEPLGLRESSRVFVCSMSDPFGEWVEPGWLDKIFDLMRGVSWHRFLLLTKRPENIVRKLYEATQERPLRALCGGEALPNVWLGCTLTGVPGESDPSWAMLELKHMGWHTFLSAEPLLGPIPADRYMLWAEWIIVGAQTQPDVQPKPEWLEPFFHSVPGGSWAPRFFKDSVARSAGYDCVARGYPDGLILRDDDGRDWCRR